MFFDDSFFSRRQIMTGGLKALCFAGLIWRTYHLQISQSAYFTLRSKKNSIQLQPLPSARGLIVDRTGTPLANNQHIFRAVFQSSHPSEFYHTLQALQKRWFFEKNTLHKLKQAFLHTQKNAHAPIIMQDQLSWSDVVWVETNLQNLPGLQIELALMRHYPCADAFAHIIGFSRTALSASDENVQNTSRMHAVGIEKYRHDDLIGQMGHRIVEINARGQVMRDLKIQPAISGSEVQTTLDAQLQTQCFQLLQSHNVAGALTVMHIPSGQMRVMLSMPSFNPHLLARSIISMQDWNTLLHHPQKPLINRVIRGLYPPGSLIKTAIVLCAMQNGFISRTTRICCPGFSMISGHRFHCWKSHGNMTAETALIQSCDVFFYELARQVPIAPFISFLETLGFGQTTSSHCNDELRGILPSPRWKKSSKRSTWNAADTALTFIGQGAFSATPLQMTVMTARLACGKKIQPLLYIAPPCASEPLETMNFHAQSWQMVKHSMHQTVHHPHGTGRHAKLPASMGIDVAGKTATCQVRRLTESDRRQKRTQAKFHEYKLREHAIFSGFAPFHNPEFAMTILVEHGGSGGAVAAPLAQEIFKIILK